MAMVPTRFRTCKIPFRYNQQMYESMPAQAILISPFHFNLIAILCWKTYSIEDVLHRGDEVYEQINQLLQATDFQGVSGRVRFRCPGYGVHRCGDCSPSKNHGIYGMCEITRGLIWWTIGATVARGV